MAAYLGRVDLIGEGVLDVGVPHLQGLVHDVMLVGLHLDLAALNRRLF